MSERIHESKVEAAKRRGDHLRGTISRVLRSDATHFDHDDAQLMKFHGIYQQDDRDVRRKRLKEQKERAHQFMVRVAVPAGQLSADQYLALDEVAGEAANASIRITTRQGLQMHGVLKGDLKATVARVNDVLLTTLAACGDVRRNVMCTPAPFQFEPYLSLRRTARALADELRPRTNAYHEIWLDGEKLIDSRDEEPFYGSQYLPRKFKCGVALAGESSIDVFSLDCALVGFEEDGSLAGFNLLVGGGQGMTHHKADTFATLARVIGYVRPEHAVEAVKAVVAIFRDHGDRVDRRHARLKYLIDRWGLNRFKQELGSRVSFDLTPPRTMPKGRFDDYIGKRGQGDGRFFYGLFVQSGRIHDRPRTPLRSTLRGLVRQFQPRVVLTPQQSILLTDLSEAAADAVEETLRAAGIATPDTLSAVRRYSLACPALPTCGLALAESERAMPDVLDRFEAAFEDLGIAGSAITIRMTGCPNGCARPYTADIAFVGRRPGVYNIYVGGGLDGDRLVDLYAADVPVEGLLESLLPLLQLYAGLRRNGEGFGDFYQRIVGREEPRRRLTGKESISPLLETREAS